MLIANSPSIVSDGSPVVSLVITVPTVPVALGKVKVLLLPVILVVSIISSLPDDLFSKEYVEFAAWKNILSSFRIKLVAKLAADSSNPVGEQNICDSVAKSDVLAINLMRSEKEPISGRVDKV